MKAVEYSSGQQERRRASAGRRGQRSEPSRCDGALGRRCNSPIPTIPSPTTNTLILDVSGIEGSIVSDAMGAMMEGEGGWGRRGERGEWRRGEGERGWLRCWCERKVCRWSSVACYELAVSGGE